MNFALYGFFLNGPALHLTYNKIIPLFGKANDFTALSKKLLFTQVIYSSISICAFYVFLSYCEGKDMREAKQEVCQKWGPTYMTNIKVWPFLQLVNFTMVPIPLQALYVNVLSVVWWVYLSYMKNKEKVITQK